MADSQNPVYTDNSTVLGDGTEEHPLAVNPSGAPIASRIQDVPGGGFTSSAICSPNDFTAGTAESTLDLGASGFSAIVGGDAFITFTETTMLLGSDNGTQNIKIGDSNGDKIGFFNTVPIVKPTVTGVKADPVAASLVTALAALGLIIDGTT